MSSDNSVSSNLPRTAPVEEKLNDVIFQLQEKYKEKPLYFLWELKKDNKKLNFDTVAKWVKQVSNLSLLEYLVNNNVLSPTESFDIKEKETSIESIKGKKCCAFSYDGTVYENMQNKLEELGAIIVSSQSPNIDFVYYADYEPLYKVPKDHRESLYSLFNKRDNGELKFEVLGFDFRHKIEEYKSNKPMAADERAKLGVLTFNHPQETTFTFDYDFVNLIEDNKIPCYESGKQYWSLSYFYEWFDCSGGEIAGTLAEYSSITNNEPIENVKKSFDVFSKLCKCTSDPKLTNCISKIVHTSNLVPGKTMVLASLEYISDFDEGWYITLSMSDKKTISIELKQHKFLKWIGDCDYKLIKLEKDGIPSTIYATIENRSYNNSFCNTNGYLWIDSASGIVPVGAFANDAEIKHIEFSNNIKRIDFKAFQNCTNLESVYIGGAVEEIGVDAFANCTNLRSVVMSSNVKIIEHRCFKNCLSLDSITFESNSKCETIEMEAFSNCISLNNITIPQKVKVIGERAFCDCTLLNTVRFENASFCKKIKSFAFSGCTSLNSINIPDRVLLCENVFQNCDALKNAMLSAKATGMFPRNEGAKRLEQALCKKQLSLDEYRNMFDYREWNDSITIMKYKGQDSIVEIPTTISNHPVTCIAQHAFENSQILEIIIPETVIEISEKAFHGCKKLQRICFKASISEFKNWFDDCESLNELFISDGVKTFSNKALCGCSKLQKISVDENSKNISEKDSILYSYDQTILLRCPPGLKTDNINIFQDVTKIANGAFSGCINLKSITLPMGVNVIGYDAFEKCTQLSDIFIPSSVSIIGTSAFNGCVNLTNIKIPISISRIDDFIFSGCANLTDVVYDGTKEQWKEASFSILKNRSPLPFVVHCCDGDLTL